MFGSILVAVDGSESNKVAVDTAIRLAKEQGAKVTALSVFDPGGYGNVASVNPVTDESDYVQKLCSNILQYVITQAEKQGVELHTKIVQGNPAEKIIDESSNHDLVVCGTLGRTGFSRIIMGSVAEKVVRLSRCPVMVCRR